MRRAHAHVVILAGGRGTRFWPWSRRALPKPFLEFGAGKSLLEEAWERARTIAAADRVWVVVSSELAPSVRRVLPRLRRDRLIVEPAPRDTAPALALACTRIREVDAEGVMILQPSDHAIDRPAAWARDASRALSLAARGGFVSLGVPPRGPETGYGYLECATKPGRAAARVVRFVEKPKAASARKLLSTGRCLWNSGSFAARAATLLAELERQRPDILRAAAAAARGQTGAWKRLAPISIDYAVLEGAPDLRAIPLTSGWDDLGSWDVASRRAGPVEAARGIVIDSPGSAVFSRGRFVAVLGVPGVAVVETKDAILVVARARSQDVRRVVDALGPAGRKDLE